MKNKILLPVVASLGMTGCATSTLDQSGAEKYVNYEIYAFVKERFVEEETSILDSVLSGANKMSQLLNGGRSKAAQARADANQAKYENDQKTTGVLPDGKSVIYKAYFNDMNNEQLYRPKKELQLFCKAIGGRFKTSSNYKKNFVSSAFENPSQVFYNTLNENFNGEVTYGLGGVKITQRLNDLKPLVAEARAEQAEWENVRLDRKGAELGYMDAANAGSFGSFYCLSIDKETLWSSTILPFSFRSKDPANNLTAHLLKVIIIPEKISI